MAIDFDALDFDQQGYRCAVGKVWITLEI